MTTNALIESARQTMHQQDVVDYYRVALNSERRSREVETRHDAFPSAWRGRSAKEDRFDHLKRIHVDPYHGRGQKTHPSIKLPAGPWWKLQNTMDRSPGRPSDYLQPAPLTAEL